MRSDLGVFFITQACALAERCAVAGPRPSAQVISEVVEIAVSIAMMYRTIKAEMSRKSEGGGALRQKKSAPSSPFRGRQHLSYLEFQAPQSAKASSLLRGLCCLPRSRSLQALGTPYTVTDEVADYMDVPWSFFERC